MCHRRVINHDSLIRALIKCRKLKQIERSHASPQIGECGFSNITQINFESKQLPIIKKNLNNCVVVQYSRSLDIDKHTCVSTGFLLKCADVTVKIRFESHKYMYDLCYLEVVICHTMS